LSGAKKGGKLRIRGSEPPIKGELSIWGNRTAERG